MLTQRGRARAADVAAANALGRVFDPVARATPEAPRRPQALIDVARVFGDEWAFEKAVPLLLEQLDEAFYLYRITCMRVRALAPSLPRSLTASRASASNASLACACDALRPR